MICVWINISLVICIIHMVEVCCMMPGVFVNTGMYETQWVDVSRGFSISRCDWYFEVFYIR